MTEENQFGCPPLRYLRSRNGSIVNGTPLLTPETVLTVALTTPGAAPTEMSNVAATAVALEITLVIVIPGIGVTVAPARPVPLNRTTNDVPALAEAGLIEDNKGPAPAIVNTTGLLVLPPAVTVTERGPLAAPGEMLKVAVI